MENKLWPMCKTYSHESSGIEFNVAEAGTSIRMLYDKILASDAKEKIDEAIDYLLASSIFLETWFTHNYRQIHLSLDCNILPGSTIRDGVGKYDKNMEWITCHVEVDVWYRDYASYGYTNSYRTVESDFAKQLANSFWRWRHTRIPDAPGLVGELLYPQLNRIVPRYRTIVRKFDKREGDSSHPPYRISFIVPLLKAN